ncbi:MAG TPA: hypothetical protein VNW92_06780 [Polyangiaceae bacterium]|nr:hypothetical protein [Polyangiaceae bacterium]
MLILSLWLIALTELVTDASIVPRRSTGTNGSFWQLGSSCITAVMPPCTVPEPPCTVPEPPCTVPEPPLVALPEPPPGFDEFPTLESPAALPPTGPLGASEHARGSAVPTTSAIALPRNTGR